MKKVNVFMFVQWLIFLPLILPLSIIAGAVEGVKKTLSQATEDIYETKEIVS